MGYKVKELEEANSKDKMSSFIDQLRIFASNNRNDESLLDTIEKAILKCHTIEDKKSLVKLYELKISQIEHLRENLPTVSELIQQMKNISEEINYFGGLALAYYKEWYVHKYTGNKGSSIKAINTSLDYVSQLSDSEEYVRHVCNYSYAVEIWLSKHDMKSSSIFENCAAYFYKNHFYRSFSQCLSYLFVIYQQAQDNEKLLNLIKKILMNTSFLNHISMDIQAIIYYYIGTSFKLSFNLNEAEKYLLEANNLLKTVYHKSIYSNSFLTSLSHLTAIYALQGKLELAYNKMKEVNKLLALEETTKNLDSFSRGQIRHTFNLTEFYIRSRLESNQKEELEKLTLTIVECLEKYHSNTIFLSEFLINANLTKNQFLLIKKINNPSTKRVEHIIDFLIEKESCVEEKQLLNRISILKRRPVEERMTLVERAFADLLAAQEYFKLERYAEIYPLLRKYEKQLHGIEVLELHIFMEAFIQIGAFKNGDPMGPALQYVAIKNCRYYGFTKLENKLLDYLSVQKNDVLKDMAIFQPNIS